jgi:hypothetical protein
MWDVDMRLVGYLDLVVWVNYLFANSDMYPIEVLYLHYWSVRW